MVDVIILRGAPGSGKSQVAKSLADYYLQGVRLEIDALRSMVISVDWTNQAEHINILHLSANLVSGFMQLGFKPIIVVDTFSGNKIEKFMDDLYKLNNQMSIRLIGLYTTKEELKKRIESRKGDEFKDFGICERINNETRHLKYDGEVQIDTTGLVSKYVAKIIKNKFNESMT